MSLSQIKCLSQAIGRQHYVDYLNNMSQMRIAFHADGKDYQKIVKDMQRK